MSEFIGLNKGEIVSKTAELIRLIGVILLSLLLLGIVCIIAIGAQQVIFNQPTPNDTFQHFNQNPNTPFETVSSLRHQYETHLENNIKTALEKITGPNTIQANVRADFNLMQETDDRSVLLPETSVIKMATLSENGTDQSGNDLYAQTTQYDFSTQKTTRNTTFEQIKKLSITVLIDGTMQSASDTAIYHPRSENEMQIYTNLIQSITGFNKERGDTLEVINLPFTDTIPFWKNWPTPILFSTIVLCVLTFLSVLILFYFIRPMMKQLITPTPTFTPTPPTQPRFKRTENKTPLDKVYRIFLTAPELSVQILRSWLAQSSYLQEENGLYRVSVLLLALGEDVIQSVFLRLTDSEMIEISRTMGTLGHIPAQTVCQIAEQFLKESGKMPDLITNQENTRIVLQKTLPTEKADRLLKEIDFPVSGKTIWEKLSHLSPEQALPLLETESSHILAVILYHLPDKQAGSLLSLMPKTKRDEVIQHLSRTGRTDPDTLNTIEETLEKRLRTLYTQAPQKTGSEKLSDILSLMDKEAENDFLATLYQSEPQTAQHISDNIMLFEHLANWDDASIQTLLKAAPKETVVLALKGASDNIKDAFSRNMAPRIWADLTKEIAHLGAVRINQIDAAQLDLLKLAHNLKNTHKVIIKD